jgi:Arc/MetJ-type ribon-helix-helix transcriptional regulator
MAVISLRLNRQETEMVDFLSNYYEQDKSSLIKYSLRELYEDIVDKDVINDYEKRESEGSISFVSAEDVIKMLHTSE